MVGQEDLGHIITDVVERCSRGWLVIDQNYKVVYVNDTYCRQRQKTREQLLGCSILDLFWDGKKKSPTNRYHGPLIETMETGCEQRNVQAFLHTKETGKSAWFSTNTFLIRSEKGNFFYAAAVYDLINDYKVMEHKLNSVNMNIIRAFSRAIDARDAYTMAHDEKVAKLMAGLAEYMGLSPREVSMAYLSGIVHDVGKIGIPEHILNKPGKLTDSEYDVIKQHTVIGAEILKEIEDFRDISNIVRYHHERYDGNGYIAGLAGQDIPFLSRMLAICDSFDAMTSERCYRGAFTVEQALSEVEKGAGGQFDDAIAKCFINYIKQHPVPNSRNDVTA